MYYAIGDFVRLGNTVKDPKHSMIVEISNNVVLSINRCSRKLQLHVWSRIHMQNGPDELQPVLSTAYDHLKADFVAEEKRYAAEASHV